MFLWFRGVKNQQKVGQNSRTKRFAKHTLQDTLFREKKKYRKVLQNKSRDGGGRTTFFVTFSILGPEGAPGASKSAPGSLKGATGRDFLRFVAVFGWSRAIFFEYFL